MVRFNKRVKHIDMWRDRLWQVIMVARTAFKWGWIPLILYLGKGKLTAP